MKFIEIIALRSNENLASISKALKILTFMSAWNDVASAQSRAVVGKFPIMNYGLGGQALWLFDPVDATCRYERIC